MGSPRVKWDSYNIRTVLAASPGMEKRNLLNSYVQRIWQAFVSAVRNLILFTLGDVGSLHSTSSEILLLPPQLYGEAEITDEYYHSYCRHSGKQFFIVLRHSCLGPTYLQF